MKRRADWFIEAMNITAPGKKGLEIGCGTGEMSNWIAEQIPLDILGTDLCEPFVRSANERFGRERLKFEVLDFTDPAQIMDRRFDVIYGNGILHHLYPVLDASLVQMKSLLRPNGKIIFMEPNIYNPYCQLIFKSDYFRKKAKLEPDEMAFSPGFIRKRLQAAGYTNIKVTYKDFLLPGIPAFLVKPSIAIGNVAERLPLIKKIAQSIFIEAQSI
ncbi:class I SAM-dependent methyltransferase [Taibaiella koreensis]|uniref:class I SAM-dependent methyltransferase n=1 Tax=Taibaiella koreensis TaxID=1268548 RepID=UPI0013C375ED|nr:class I SAM-dependent methyltransferase [Taibaiella koreensis]